MDILLMRQIEIKKGDFSLKEKVECVYERVITKFGNSAKVDAQKKHIGKRAYVIVLKD
jgi:putative transposon-encoded protein